MPRSAVLSPERLGPLALHPTPTHPTLARGRSHCSSPDVPPTPPPPALLQPLPPPYSHPPWRLARGSPDHAISADHRCSPLSARVGPGQGCLCPSPLGHVPWLSAPQQAMAHQVWSSDPHGQCSPCSPAHFSPNHKTLPWKSVPRGKKEMWVVMAPAVTSPNVTCQPRDLVATPAWRAARFPSALGSDLSLLSGAQRGPLALGPGYSDPNTPQGPPP